MGRVRRIHVEKRPGSDHEARSILTDLRDHEGIAGLAAVRVFNRYDMEGPDGPEFEAACATILSEPPVDRLFAELPADGAALVLAIEPLPGQYDQRADSAAQCVQILVGGERPACRAARVVVLYGDLADGDADRVRKALINPVECREASMALPATLSEPFPEPGPIPRLSGFRDLAPEGLRALRAELGLAMSEADAAFCQAFFRQEGRDPTLTEIRVLDTYWSDHCRHTTFLTRLLDIEIEGEGPVADSLREAVRMYRDTRAQVYGDRAAERPECLMDLATLAMKSLRQRGAIPDLDLSKEINACSIRATVPVDGRDEEWLIQFKNETHNHPTEIEPFGGAATCLGGAIRDPLSGRAYVYQAMRVTGSGDPTRPSSETRPGKLSQRRITTTAAAGFSSYGNQVGLATGLVEELYHPGYVAKRMEIGAVIAAAPASQVVRAEPEPGDVVLLLGGRTGRDGCGGATGSSKSHDATSLVTCGAEVQKGNPPTERKLQRLFRNPEAACRIRRCNDFGAGGVSVAIGELADGLSIDLDAVPRKYEGLDGTELAISESQERMAVVVSPGDADDMVRLAGEENLEATPVARVTGDARMTMTWRGDVIVDLPRSFLDSNGAPADARARVALPAGGRPRWFQGEEHADGPVLGVPLPETGASSVSFAARLAARLASLEGCSRQGLVERFDGSIGAASLLMPFGGSAQRTPEPGMAARLPVLHGETDAATAMTFGFDPWLSSWSPYHGAYYAVCESLARLSGMGVRPERARLSLQEYFERLGQDPRRWGKPLAALLGAFRAQLELGVPAIGGKDSMSGSFLDLDVPPTLVSFAVGVGRVGEIRGSSLPGPGRILWLLRPSLRPDGLPVPDRFLAGLSLAARMVAADPEVRACAVHATGVAATAARMAFGEGVGCRFRRDLADPVLFGRLPGALLLCLPDGSPWPDRFQAEGLPLECVGQTTPEPTLGREEEEATLSLDAAWEAFDGTLRSVFPPLGEPVPVPGLPEYELPAPAAPDSMPAAPIPGFLAGTGARPRVLIPVFPGTNCEYDTARAFERAGGDPRCLVFRNRTPDDIAESLDALRREIGEAHIIALPGGFSGGDEPDGSAKFLATAFRNPAVAEAVMALLERRDGLVLGICNGFQALVKLGLVPYGRILPQSADSPTLTFNRIGRHVSRYVRTRIQSVASPWLMETQKGEVHWIPVSHGEGRFLCPEAEHRRLLAAGQVATVYVDADHRPTGDPAYNPNGSFGAVEGLLGAGGRVFGKMGHSERTGPGVAGNLPGQRDQGLFRSGIRYFL